MYASTSPDRVSRLPNTCCDYGLVHRGGMTVKFDFESGQDGEDNDGEMDGDRILIWQAVRHLFCS